MLKLKLNNVEEFHVTENDRGIFFVRTLHPAKTVPY